MAEKADLVLLNGKVRTLDDEGTVASAVAVKDGRIAAVGSDDEIEQAAGPKTRRMNLDGAVVLPGIIDSHLHVAGLGQTYGSALLFDVGSIEEIVERLQEHAAKVSGPVIGRGGNFHETSLVEGRLPNAADLDRVSTERPVMITDVNKSVVNSLVLGDIDVADVPPGGEVPLGDDGGPLGIFLYSAKRMTPLGGQADTPSEMSLEDAILKGLEYCARLGITGVVAASSTPEEIAVYGRLASQGELPLRVTALPVMSPVELSALGAAPGLEQGLFTFGPIKLVYDAFVMHKTALMYEPFEGEPDNCGRLAVRREEFERRLKEAVSGGWPVAIHTTGDRGMDETIDALAAELDKSDGVGRCHLIHTYFPTDEAIETCRRLGVAIAAQPTFIRTWGETVRRFAGEKRAERFVPLRSMLDCGLIVGGGADAPITWPCPWTGMYAATARKTEGGNVLGGDESVLLEEALRMYTSGSAAVVNQEYRRGTIEAGKDADFTVVDRDVVEVDTEAVLGTKALKTIVGGRVVCEAGR